MRGMATARSGTVTARATLSSVARLAGVSTSTASRALTGDRRVAPQTRRRVQDAAESLRYRPNRIASGLRTRRTGLVAFALPDLRDPWWVGVTEALQDVAGQDGVQLLTHVTGGDPAAETALLEGAVEFGFDAVVLGTRTDAGDRLRPVVDSGTAAVTVGGVVPGGGVPAVLPDLAEATRLLTAHLTGLGHRRIACVLGPDDDLGTPEAHAGFVRGLAEAGVPLRADRVLTGERSVGFGSSAVDRLGMRAGSPTGGAPTAVVTSSWFVAVGVVGRLQQLGLGVGTDVSVVLAEGTPAPFEGWTGPALTSVADQAGDVARIAWSFVSPEVEPADGVPHPDVVRLTPQLAPAASSGPPPG